MTRTPCCEKEGLRKGPWMPDEDEKLIKYIGIHGEGNWSSVPRKAGLIRCGKSCRLRWANYLRPDLKRGTFSEEEENLILSLHEAIGNRWARIAQELPGRTDNDIKNHWNTRMKRRLRDQGIDPLTHKPLSVAEAEEVTERKALKRGPLPGKASRRRGSGNRGEVEDRFKKRTFGTRPRTTMQAKKQRREEESEEEEDLESEVEGEEEEEEDEEEEEEEEEQNWEEGSQEEGPKEDSPLQVVTWGVRKRCTRRHAPAGYAELAVSMDESSGDSCKGERKERRQDSDSSASESASAYAVSPTSVIPRVQWEDSSDLVANWGVLPPEADSLSLDLPMETSGLGMAARTTSAATNSHGLMTELTSLQETVAAPHRMVRLEDAFISKAVQLDSMGGWNLQNDDGSVSPVGGEVPIANTREVAEIMAILEDPVGSALGDCHGGVGPETGTSPSFFNPSLISAPAVQAQATPLTQNSWYELGFFQRLEAGLF